MRRLVVLLLVLLAAVIAALALVEDPGYVLIRHGAFAVELSLTLAVLVLAAVFVALHVLLRLAQHLLRLPAALAAWRRRRQAERARARLVHGLVELSEGHWERAEKTLRRAEHSEAPLIHHLAAAYAAQEQGAHERRDHHLERARARPGAELAAGLTQARLQLAERQFAEALATLRTLHARAPRHGHVLKLLRRVYEQTGDWAALNALLPDLRRRGVLGNDEIERLEVQATCALLKVEAGAHDLADLQRHWNRLPRRLRDEAGVVACYADLLAAREANAALEPLLRDTLKRRWQPELVAHYGRLNGPDPARALASAEAWLKQHREDPVLLLALGRLARRNRLWGKARSYLEASLGAQHTAETCAELASLLEQMKDTPAALGYYREGMQLALRQAG
jgi:HemY protein